MRIFFFNALFSLYFFFCVCAADITRNKPAFARTRTFLRKSTSQRSAENMSLNKRYTKQILRTQKKIARALTQLSIEQKIKLGNKHNALYMKLLKQQFKVLEIEKKWLRQSRSSTMLKLVTAKSKYLSLLHKEYRITKKC